jgi:hypothetical protein
MTSPLTSSGWKADLTPTPTLTLSLTPPHQVKGNPAPMETPMIRKMIEEQEQKVAELAEVLKVAKKRLRKLKAVEQLDQPQ